MHKVHQLLTRAAREKQFQSACLLVASEGEPVLHQAYGRGRLETIYDLASLTKPLATTAVAMQLCARGELALSTRLRSLLPELDRPETRGLTVRQLLGHCSGLPAWRPYFAELRAADPRRRRAALRRRVAAEPLAYRPGATAVYSDLGFILLDWALERQTGRRLDRLARREIFAPLGLRQTFFIDLALRAADRRQRLLQTFELAPTERCPWRKRRLQGEVHDDNCWVMGGVSGHAGLFSTAYEVHLIARELVAAAQGGPSLFSGKVVRQFWRSRPVAAATRVLGWDTPSARGSSAGRFFPPSAVGHLGFTGTSLWIDWQRPRWVVLLSNRVYYGREQNPMPALRPRVHDAILRALDRIS